MIGTKATSGKSAVNSGKFVGSPAPETITLKPTSQASRAILA